MSDTTRKFIPLSETTKFIVDNRGRTAPTSSSGIKLIATNCISNSNLYPSYENLRYVSQETYDNWFRAHPEPGDILLTLKGSQNGAVCLVPDPVDFVIAQDMVALRANETIIDPLFLFAALRSTHVQEQIKNLDVSGVIPHFKKSDFDKLLLPYPDKPTQRFIGELHFALCAKIEANRQINETLEAMARAIFKDWFIDFGPVRAKMSGDAQYLPTEIWSLFPDRFDEEGNPEGWSKTRLGEFFKLERGLSYKGEFLSDEGRPLINLGCFLGSGSFSYAKLKYYTGDFRPRHTVSNGTLVLANTDMTQNRTILGSPHIVAVDNHQNPALFTHHVYAARPTKAASEAWTLFFYFQLLQPDFRERAEGFATGTTVLFLPSDAAENFTFIIPSDALRDAFEAFVSPMLQQKGLNDKESDTLVQCREFLIPKLMSGEIGVTDAEKLAEKAA